VAKLIPFVIVAILQQTSDDVSVVRVVA